MAIRYGNPKIQYFYSNGPSFGEPLVDGYLYFYDSGTLNLKATYADSGLSIVNPNPMRLDGAGRISSPFLDGNYKVILQDSTGAQQFELDPIQGSLAGGQWEDWDVSTTYSSSDLVRGSDDFYYKSITNNNLGNNPVSSMSDWSQILFIVQWNPNETYPLNANASESGAVYRSLQDDNLNNLPSASPAFWGASSGGIVAGNPVSLLTNDVPYLDANSNLSDVVSASDSRDNLGLGTAAVVDTGLLAANVPLNSDLGTAAYVDTGTGAENVPTITQADARYLLETNNLSDLTDDATARSNLGVSSTAEGDARYLLETNNLSDLTSAPTARTNLGVYSKAETDAIGLGPSTLGALGTYAFLWRTNAGSSISDGQDITGASLEYAGVNNNSINFETFGSGSSLSSPSGTWRAMGSCGGKPGYQASTLFKRIL